MARLNLFQKIMLLWDDVLPYNAAHGFRVGLALDRENLRGEIQVGLAACGYAAQRDEIVLREYGASTSLEEAVAEVMRTELNGRFDRGASSVPFRFFVIPSEGEEFFFGVCYFHLVAGGDSICWMLEDIVSRYAGREGGEAEGKSGERPPSYRSLLPGHLSFFWRWVSSIPADLRRSRSFARLSKAQDGEGGGMGVVTHPLTKEQWDWIRRRKAEAGVTFNDVLLCLALLAAVKDRPKKIRHPRRKKIAIGGIANTRRHFGEGHARTFGLFVAFTSVAQDVPEGVRIGELLAKVHEETEATKKDRLYLRDLIKLEGSLLWMKSRSPEARRSFYRKYFPLFAGVTSFYVDQFQSHLTELPVSDYWRAVSASPANPLVLACTTFGERATIAVTYDRSLYSDEAASLFLKGFLELMKVDTTDE